MSRPPLPTRSGRGEKPTPPSKPGGGAKPPPPARPQRPRAATKEEIKRTIQPTAEDIPDAPPPHVPKEPENKTPSYSQPFVPPTVLRVADDGWSERYTMDGAPYYFNVKTEAVSWNCPESLKDSEELIHEGGNWRWVPDPEDAWIPAREIESGVFLTEDGQRVEPTAKDPVWPIMMSSLRHVEQDLVMIDDMNEGLIIHNIRERFKRDEIYTSVGTILVSVNPFKRLPLYMPTIMEMYYKSGGNKKLPPHTFGIADHAYKDMREFRKNMSILISGESGAGKTEATKQCLAFLAEVAGSSGGVEEKIIEANPILEALGNAKTGRNNNSSRFGKFLEIHFDKLGHIVGARTENYLLEKSRVVFQTSGERNYHIFYMLCVGSLQSSLNIDADMEKHRYLNQSGCLQVDGVDDRQEFQEVLDAMDCLGFSPEEKKWIFETIAAVLLLGDLEFKGQDAAIVANPPIMDQIVKFLGADPKEFHESIVSRWFVIRGQEPTKIPFKPVEATAAADACAKAIYGNLFDWIVQRVNRSMEIPQGTETFIGVLDIFGFEIFEVNSFEQLCINFANEKLQQHFNEYTFKLEETVYQSEQIKFFHIEFIDNQPILDMIEKKPKGLLVQLDEEIRMPKGTDETWFNKISRDFEKTQYFVKIVKKKGHFTVKHYAGNVPYDSDGFLEKNRDSLWPDIAKALRESSNKNTSSLFPEDPGASKGRAATLGGQFRGQLTNLMEKLRSTDPSYIRCVKPNSLKKPDVFDSVMSLQQLRYAGVFEAIKIRQQGFPFRYTFIEFMRRYKCLAMKDGGWISLKGKNDKDRIKEILDLTKQNFSDVQIGRTMVLYRAPQQRVLELLRNLALERICLVIQKWLRGCFARRFRWKLTKSRPHLLGAIKTRISLGEATAAIEFVEGAVGTYSRIFPFKSKEWIECQELKRQLVERKRATDLCSEVLPKDPESNFSELEGAVQAGLAIEEYPGTPEQFKIFQDTKALYDLTVNRRNCRAELIRATATAERVVLEATIKLAAELGIPDTLEIGPAKAMVERCKAEEALCAELEAAQAKGGMLNWADGPGVIDTQTLQGLYQKAVNFEMKTAPGKRLQNLVEYLQKLRTALKSSPFEGFSEWVDVRSLLDSQPMCPVEGLSEVADHPEVMWAYDETIFRERQRDIHEPLRQGISELNEDTLRNFLQFIEENPAEISGQDQISRLKKIEDELVQSGKGHFERVEMSRTKLQGAVSSEDEVELKSAIENALSLPVDSSHALAQLELLVQAEILLAMKFHIDFGQRSEVGLILDEYLSKSSEAKVASFMTGVEFVVLKSDLDQELTTQANELEAALKHASEVEVLSDSAQEHVAIGKVLLDLRRCLSSRDWDSLDEKLAAVQSVRPDGPESNLARDEIAGRLAAHECIEALKVAVSEVVNHTDDNRHPSEAALDLRLAESGRLELQDLPDVVAAQEMLAHLRKTNDALASAMIFHIDYGRRVEIGLILDDELADSEAAQVLSLSSGAEISVTKAAIIQELATQSTALDGALVLADQISLVTRVVLQGRVLIDLRRCLLNHDWASLDPKLSAALSLKVDGPETNLAKDEMAGRSTAADCLEALKAAVDDVKNSSDDFGHPSEGILDSRLAQAERLEMKDLPEVVAGREMLDHIRNCQKEIENGMTFPVEYGKRVAVGLIIDDHLCKSTAVNLMTISGGEVAVQKSDLLKYLTDQSDALEAGLKHADEIQLVTRLILQGRSLLALRRCLLAQDWDSLDEKLSAAQNLQIDGPETNLTKDEIHGRTTAHACLQALNQAVADVVQPSDVNAHPSEAALENRLAEAERLELNELPDVVSGREMLERIRNTRRELQIGLTVSQYDDAINLAEEYEKLYLLFEASTKQLNIALDMAKEFSYATKETIDAAALQQEVTILWYLQEDLQLGGYYEGANPTKAPQETVVLEPITSHYTDYSGFNFVTEIGKYVLRKCYFILTIRGAIHDICNNPDQINAVIPAAEEIGCPTTPELVSGREFMDQLNVARAACPEAERIVREDLLINAIKLCDALFYNNDDVERVRALKLLVIELNEESRKAMWVLDKERMKNVLQRAKDIRLTTVHFEYIQYLVDLGPMDWLKFEIKKAAELEELNRKIRLSIEMKDLTLTQFGSLFGLNSLKNMRSPENYASQKLLTLDRKKLALGMLQFSKVPAHTSLIDFAQLIPDTDPQAHKTVQHLIKDSTRTFKNIMGYMGDKKYPYPTTLVTETIQMCLDNPMLRSEVYLQTIKQISNHPVPANKRKGYELLAVWCWQFPSQDDLDNILETYLRGVPEKSISYLGRLRDVIYQGPSRTAPSEAQIEAFIKEFFTSVPKRSRYEENVEPIQDSPYTDEFFRFENQKSLFRLDEEDARLKVT